MEDFKIFRGSIIFCDISLHRDISFFAFLFYFISFFTGIFLSREREGERDLVRKSSEVRNSVQRAFFQRLRLRMLAPGDPCWNRL